MPVKMSRQVHVSRRSPTGRQFERERDVRATSEKEEASDASKLSCGGEIPVTECTWAKYIPNVAQARLGENSLGGET